ncbi:MAG: hypothetical protein ACRD38_10035 [Nitrososphaerales archaeon]
MSQTILQFLKPNWKRLEIFGVFTFIAIAGYMQSWVFSGRDMGLPKPPLFDLLSPFPFWLIWVSLLSPLALLSNALVMIGGNETDFVMGGSFWILSIVNLAYFYVLSCLVIFIWDKFRIKK